MKRLFFMIPLIVLFGGCSLFRPPEPVVVGSAKAQESLEAGRESLVKFTEASLKSLEIQLLERVDEAFAERSAALKDAEGKVPLGEAPTSVTVNADGKVTAKGGSGILKEFALATAARNHRRKYIRDQFAKFYAALRDIDNAIAINRAVQNYLARDDWTRDAVQALKIIDKIAKGTK